MKIMFYIPSLGSGGAERVISTLANEFSNSGNDVVIGLIRNDICCYELNKNVVTTSLNCDEDMGFNRIKRVKLRRKKIRNLYLQHKPDVVISFLATTNIDVCFALKNENVPVIVSERNDPSVEPRSKIKKIIRKIAYLYASGFVFQTEDAKNYFSKKIQKKSTVIINPLYANLPDVFKGERENRIVAVGRLNYQKNYPLLIDAYSEIVKEFPDYTLEIYGKGELEQELHELVESKRLKGNVNFKGFCSNVHEEIKKASLFVMSSDFEGMPNALLEALALGIPCISTDCPCGGPKTLIKNGENGLLVPIKDKGALVNAIKKVLSDKVFAENLGNNATKIREIASVDVITSKWLEYIEKTVNR
ncbi:MAG: glycosyltransferase family 4 protein [Clostridiales bacterium]|nr:glycosyltransferase family 4 protein [Clostridiales bacterium]